MNTIDLKTISKCLVQSGNIVVHTDSVITTGLSTCIFLVIETKTCMIGWHYMFKLNAMKRVHAMLKLVKDVQKVYMIPGIDRDEQFYLKLDCRTMKINPHDPKVSYHVLMQYLKQFPWSHKIEPCRIVSHYKDFVLIKKGCPPKIIKDEKSFDKICVWDAEKDSV